MEIDEKILKQVAAEAKTTETGKKTMIHSHPASVILRYLSLITPKFSCGGAATELLEGVIKQEYPDLWERVIQEDVPGITELEKSYWPKKFPRIDEAQWQRALEETTTRRGKIITAFHPRIAAVLRYCAKTTPRFSISEKAAGLLGSAIKARYPEVWKRVEADVRNSS